MAPPPDLYLIATPLFAVLALATLIALKLSLKRSNALNPNQLSKLRNQNNADQQTSQETSIFQRNQTLKIFSFFAKTQTFLEPCLTKRSKNKLPLFMILSFIGILSFFFPAIYFFCIVGAPLALFFVFMESCFEVNRLNEAMENNEDNFSGFLQQVKQQTQYEQKKQYIYISYGIAACGMFLALCSFTFKNYLNSELTTFLITFVINGALDIFIVRPVLFLLMSLPLKFNLRIQIHIGEENLRNKLQNLSEKIQIKECANGLSPKKKKSNSPTKVPKAQRLQKQNVGEDTLNAAMQLVKRVKKQKKALPGLITPLSRRNKVQEGGMLQEYSLNHLFENDKSNEDKFNQTPIAHFNFENQDESIQQSGVKTRRKNSDLMIIEFKNKVGEKEEQEKQEEVVEENGDIRKRIGSFLHSNLDFEEYSQIKDKKEETQNEQDTLKIIKVSDSKGQEDEEQEVNQNDDEDTRKSRKNQQKQNFMSHKVGLLCINEQTEERQIQEIDINSPEKRRRMKEQECYDGQIVKKKYKAKHTNSNAKRRLIQFTSGEPYLQYLPKMLSKQMNQHTKRSQPIAFKNDISELQEKPRKSLKKMKARRQPKVTTNINNENQCPQAIYIQDL